MPIENELHRTVLHARHLQAGARMVEFAGWEMPLQYGDGIVAEHLATRAAAGLFDVSHMGRFAVRGGGAPALLQHVLTNNAEALDVGMAQYTIIADPAGGAIDDAYLYRFTDGEYLLVVNAANRQKDWRYFQEHLDRFPDTELIDRTDDLAMVSLQGPKSRELLAGVIDAGRLPEPVRNALSIVTIAGVEVWVGRTGYTGEPVCFELFIAADSAVALWDLLVQRGATPVGLGARDTLRLEAGLPLYGHEFGLDPTGREIPILACRPARLAVSFSARKGDFVGREALARQHEALKRIDERDYSRIDDLPRLIQPVALVGPGVARAGAKVFKDGRHVGFVTSGTRVPYWIWEGAGLHERLTDRHALRSIALAYLDCRLLEEDRVEIEIRGKRVEAVVVACHLRSDAPPYARPVVRDQAFVEAEVPAQDTPSKVRRLLQGAIDNTVWRQRRCMNLIPSEMTPSPMVRLLSVMDPVGRYAEHRKLRAFGDLQVFYYQGTDFIRQVEELLEAEMRTFLGCREVEARPVSGQTANMVVFGALVDYLNRGDRRAEPRRIGPVMSNHLGKGGHLSAQPMGALRDYVARDGRTERPAVVHFPVMADNPYRMDVPAAVELIAQSRPELIILGKSVVLHPEPVAEIRACLDAEGIDAVLMYDMAHVLGLVGPHFQQPFAEGADLVTASTHKTFFGTQRGIVAGDWPPQHRRYKLWEAVRRRAFPGSLSNHHLGTMLGLLMAAYEMNHFKDEYQRQVIANAKAFARALHDAGLDVAGDPAVDFTETHQVVVHVGYGRGPELARRLEENNIICNYQAAPDEEGFTASGALRLGVAEMTRWGMGPGDFAALAGLMRDVVVENANVADAVARLREPFCELKYCFRDEQYADLLGKLYELL